MTVQENDVDYENKVYSTTELLKNIYLLTQNQEPLPEKVFAFVNQ